MEPLAKPGQIVILNGVPRSGKSSIVTAIQEIFDGVWMNLGVDTFVRHVTPKRYGPGMASVQEASVRISSRLSQCSTPPCMSPSLRTAGWV
jgi:chloramphenicol 3-O-phosphotransferase